MINLLEEEPVNIAGVLFSAQPEKVEEVSKALGEFPGAEVHVTNEKGNMVVTIEEDKKLDQNLIEIITNMSNVPGVISSSLIYHHNDVGLPQHQEEK